MQVKLLVLNFNGRQLLATYLPSVVRAADAAGVYCTVGVIDNDSTDGSRQWLATNYPDVRVWHRPNRGLCSFNDVLAQIDSPVAVLLNNDIELDSDFVRRLIQPLQRSHTDYDPRCFMTAPLCWARHGRNCEGFKTAVRWRYGLVQATGRFEGHEPGIFEPGLTASAGAALAVDRQRFLELGGFDPLFLPGRIEDLDFAYRGYQAGYHARYVPQAICYHQGMATFGAVFGEEGCDALALRNTLLFQWKNLRTPRHRLYQVGGIAARVATDLARSLGGPPGQRWKFVRALAAAWAKRRELTEGPQPARDAVREQEFFQEFLPRRLAQAGAESVLFAARCSSRRASRHHTDDSTRVRWERALPQQV
ncbi:MAG: glycosyltransferase [Planctomycetaceae bacterium]|nr:glycosyltransferase [Planctomycetaceae bacterium]